MDEHSQQKEVPKDNSEQIAASENGTRKAGSPKEGSSNPDGLLKRDNKSPSSEDLIYSKEGEKAPAEIIKDVTNNEVAASPDAAQGNISPRQVKRLSKKSSRNRSRSGEDQSVSTSSPDIIQTEDTKSRKVPRKASKRNSRANADSENQTQACPDNVDDELLDNGRKTLLQNEGTKSAVNASIKATSSNESETEKFSLKSAAEIREQKFRKYSNKTDKSRRNKEGDVKDRERTKSKESAETEKLVGDHNNPTPDSDDEVEPDNSTTKRQTIDVSQFLDVKSFSNTVEIVVNNKKFICSGAVLSYHSPVIARILMTGANIITLDELCTPGTELAVEECLMLLYGGGAVLTINNIETMTKFSVIYQVENLYRLCCEWIRHYVSVENVYDLWLLGNVNYISGKQKRKKNDIIHICRNFIKNKECEIALELRKRKKAKVEIEEGFILLMLQFTDYSTMFSDLL